MPCGKNGVPTRVPLAIGLLALGCSDWQVRVVELNTVPLVHWVH